MYFFNFYSYCLLFATFLSAIRGTHNKNFDGNKMKNVKIKIQSSLKLTFLRLLLNTFLDV